jgi:cyanate permease
LLIAIGALLSGGSWVLAALADNIWALYFTYGVLGGIGTGIVYVGIIGLMVLVFFGWGEIFSLFPSTLTDTFGPRYAATNYGFLYMAQGVGSILGGPAAAFLKQATGSWTAVFVVVALLDALTALLAITALRRMRQGHLAAG